MKTAPVFLAVIFIVLILFLLTYDISCILMFTQIDVESLKLKVLYNPGPKASFLASRTVSASVMNKVIPEEGMFKPTNEYS